MYAGRIIEHGAARDVLVHPQHPYTRAMLSSTIKDRHKAGPLGAIGGSPPDLRALPEGCSFAPRCPYAGPECLPAMPAPVVGADGHTARCVRTEVVDGVLEFRPGTALPA